MADSKNGTPSVREAEDFEIKGLNSPRGPNYASVAQVALRRISLLVLGLVVGGVLGVLYYAQSTPLYESRAQLLIVKKRPDALPMGSQDAIQAQSDDYLSTQVGILKSPLIVARALQDKDLEPLQSSLSGDAVLRSLTATRDPKDPRNNILYLTFRAPASQDSQLVLKAIAAAYKQFIDETYKSVSDETVKLITHARDILEKDLTKKEAAYREFRLKSPVLLLRGKSGTSLNQEQLLNLQARMSATQLRHDELQGRLDELEKAVKEGRSREELILMASQLGSAPVALDDGGRKGPGKTVELASALFEEKWLLEDHGPNHPQVQAIRKRADLARAFIMQTLSQEMKDATLSIRSLEAILKETLGNTKATMTYEIEDDGFRNNISRTQQLYDAVLRRLQEVDIVRDFGGYTTQVIQPPTAGFKVSPQLIMIFPALCLGLLGGLGLAFLADYTDKTFRSAEEIRRRLDLPVIAHIPLIQADGDISESVVRNGAAIDPVVCCYHRPKSREAETYRAVRTSLYFSARAGGHKVIQVTSPTAGDGKTTLAVNLAVSIAQSGKKVLLVDADMRRPRLHQLLGLSKKRGLASLILEECKAEEAIVQLPALEGLAVLPCGRPPPNPAELLTSLRFQDLLNALREQYEFVIVDSPPLLAVTDPCVVAARVDGVLLTFRISKNGRPLVERAHSMLAALGTKVLGVVVNGVRVHRAGYEGYGYDGYTYSKYDYDHYRGSSKGSHDYYEEDKQEGSDAGDAPEPVNGDATHDAPPSG